MTVSQRASNIYKLTKPSGGTWKEAMSQAYEEIAREEMEREEKEASEELENLAQNISDAYNRSAIFMYGNELVAEIIITALDKMAETSKYPASAIMRRIREAGGPSFIESMVFWSSGDERYNAKYRNSEGKISSSWWSNVNHLMNILGVSPSDLDYYDVVSQYFI